VTQACEIVVKGWKNSPPHFESIVNPALTETGIGVARGADGAFYFCQLFAKPLPD
jgi:uncharacterized protein YkwD